jgi:hypothetical protein
MTWPLGGGQYCGAAPGHAHGIVFWKGHARGIVFWRAKRIYTISSMCLAAVSSTKRRQTSLHNAQGKMCYVSSNIIDM